MFLKRMANHFENNYINEPVEEITHASWVQKQLARARGTNAPYVG
jgi:hypothetical protein